MSRIEIDTTGMDSLKVFVQDRVGGRLSGQMVDDARRYAPVDTGGLKASGRVIRMGPELWRISFGEGLPDARAVYQEVGTGGWFFQPAFVSTDFGPLRGRHPGHVRARAYIRNAVYQERVI